MFHESSQLLCHAYFCHTEEGEDDQVLTKTKIELDDFSFNESDDNQDDGAHDSKAQGMP